MKIKDRTSNKSFIEILSSLNPPTKASGILTAFPMKNLARFEWTVYQWFLLLFVLIHLGIMSWYTYESQNMIGDIKDDLRSAANGQTLADVDADIDLFKASDYAVLIYSITLFILMALPFIFHKCITNYCKR